MWVDVSDSVPELSEAVGAIQDIVPVANPLSVLLDWVLGHPVIVGPSTSEMRKVLQVRNKCVRGMVFIYAYKETYWPLIKLVTGPKSK